MDNRVPLNQSEKVQSKMFILSKQVGVNIFKKNFAIKNLHSNIVANKALLLYSIIFFTNSFVNNKDVNALIHIK